MLRVHTSSGCTRDFVWVAGDSERMSRCGQLYNGVASLAKAYNASICAAYGKPDAWENGHHEMMQSMFKLDDAKQAAAAIARCYAKHPEDTVRLADICFNHCDAEFQEHKHENCAALYQHLSLKTPDQVADSLELNDSLRRGEWSALSHLSTDVQQKQQEQVEAYDKQKDVFRIGDPYNFPWIEPRNAMTAQIYENSSRNQHYERGRRIRPKAYTKKAMVHKATLSAGSNKRKSSCTKADDK